MDFSVKKLNPIKLVIFALLPLGLYYVLQDIIYTAIIFASTFMLRVNIGSELDEYILVYGEKKLEELLLKNATEHSMEILLVSQLCMIPIMFALFKFDFFNRKQEDRLYKCYYSWKLPKYLFIVGFGFFGMYFGNFLVSFISFFLPQSSIDKYSEVADVLYSGPMIVQFLCIVVGAPLLEELLIRGIVYNRIKDYIGIVSAAIVSAVSFGILHGNLVQGLYATFIGLMLAFVYEKYKSIWAPILMHAVCNAFSLITTYLAQSVDTGEEVAMELSAELVIQFMYLLGVTGTFMFLFGFLIYKFVNPVSLEKV